MLQLINLPADDRTLSPFANGDEITAYVRACGCDGVEMIYGGMGEADVLPAGLAVGYHIGFYPDWLDFWQGNEKRLREKFGTPEVWEGFYGGTGRQALLDFYAADFRRARQVGAKYVVFHVTDFSIEEGYLYRWAHADREVIEETAGLLNQALSGEDWPFTLLLENLFTAGFTMTDPALTQLLLDLVEYPDKGIMLDTGHLMCTNLSLATQREAVAYAHHMLDQANGLCKWIRGVHLHQSVSGAYVKAHTGRLPSLPDGYYEKYGVFYTHLQKIDTHQPITVPEGAGLVKRIAPEVLVHELSVPGMEEKKRATLLQQSFCCPR